MSQADRHTTDGEHMQGCDQSQSISRQGWAQPGLRTMSCWGEASVPLLFRLEAS